MNSFSRKQTDIVNETEGNLPFTVRFVTTFLILIFFACSAGHGQNVYEYSEPKNLDDGWETNSMDSLDIDSAIVYKLFSQLKDGDHKLHSALVVKNGQLIIEEYFNDHSVNKPHDLRSTTKSIRSILMGIAIDKGYIENVNDPIAKYLKTPVPKKNLDERKKQITIKHLLTMSTGLDCNDWDQNSRGQEDRVYKKKDWLQFTLDLPVVNEPGEVSNYCSMGAILAAEVISQASGMTIDSFAQEYLFNPLGIDNLYWGHTSDKKVIPSGKRLYMTPRDMAKIGQLVLNQGNWKGEQIVSEKWIEEATTPKTKIANMDYGYLWWNIPFRINEKMVVSKTATGNGGQYIMIIPEMDLVAVFTGGAYNSQGDKLAFAIMNDVFLPAIQYKK